MNDPALAIKIDRARWWALSNAPFYGQLVMGLRDVLRDIPTASTDGRVINWGREFLGGLTDEETRFVLLHESLHCAYGHLWRLPPSDPDAQRACDLAINLMLSKVGGIKMPAKGLLDPVWEGKAEEEIFASLKRARPLESAGDDLGDGGGGDPVEDPGECGAFEAPAPDKPVPEKQDRAGAVAPASLQDEWEERVCQAAQASKAAGCGDLPADAARMLARVRAQSIDWHQETAEFVKLAVGTRNDWARSSRRMAGQPVIYPRKRAEKLGLVVFVRDTSGSISDEVCAEFNDLIGGCLQECGAEAILMDCDAALQSELRLAPGDEVPQTAKGGGGTCFVPPFVRCAELVENEGETIAGLVYLTDLDGPFSEKGPDFPVLWISTTPGSQAPFGRTVEVHKCY